MPKKEKEPVFSVFTTNVSDEQLVKESWRETEARRVQIEDAMRAVAERVRGALRFT